MKLRLLFSLLFGALLSTGFGQSIGVIGSATPTGWDSDTDMVQNPDSAHLWSLDLTLAVGEVKFRQDDAWDINWGKDEYPAGIGEQGGPNIPVPVAGEYTITFNSQTGLYYLELASEIGLIGSAGPFGWDKDVNMLQDAVDQNEYSITIRLKQGAVKFRANDAWDLNWGSTEFPTGTATANGPDIPIAIAGKYIIHFNKSTGAYSFEEIAEFTTIGIIGSATPGGWDADTDMTRDVNNPDIWKATLVLTDGEAKFRANDAWDLNWGGDNFPSGVGVAGGNNIPVTAGEYLITFNTATLEYNFYPIYTSIGIIGDATPGGWDNETAMMQDPNDKTVWRLRLVLANGEVQFRANNAWDTYWGAGDFPTGTAELEGPPVPVPAGEYKITFNTATGQYSFEELIIYGTIGLVGTATPLASWDTDVDMTKDPNDETVWFISSIELSAAEAKFRAEDAWTVNWGAPQFPTGVGSQNGPNIQVAAGTYRVTLATVTGEYAFSEPSSTVNLLDESSIRIAPNPAKSMVNIEVNVAEMQGETRVVLFNNMGQQVLATNVNIQNRVSIPVGNLMPGQYTLQLTNGKNMVGKQVVIVK